MQEYHPPWCDCRECRVRELVVILPQVCAWSMVMFSTSVRFPSGPAHTTLGTTVSPSTTVTVHVIANSFPTIALSSGGVLIWTVAQAWGTSERDAQILQLDYHKFALCIAISGVLLTLHCDFHCLLLHTVRACHPAGVLSVMIVSRHWVQYQGQGLAAGVAHSNTICDPLNCGDIQVSGTHTNRHSIADS